MKLPSVLLSLVLFATTAFGQQRVLIEYDFLKDDFKFYQVKKNGERVETASPKAVRNQNVKVEVINFNQFLYTAKASFTSETQDENASLGFLNMISPLGLSNVGSNFLTQLAPVESTRGGLMASPDAKNAYSSFQAAYQSISDAEQSLNDIKYITQKLHQLKYNAYLPSDSIKLFTQKIVSNLMGKPAVQTQDFMALGSQINNSISAGMQELTSSTQSFHSAYNSFASTRGKDGGFAGEGMDAQMDKLLLGAQAFDDNFDYSELISHLDILEATYQSIMNTSFVFNTSKIAEGDKIKMHIDFYKIPEEGADVSNYNDLKKVKSKDLDITVKGDMKINSSVGLSFPWYANNVSFINKDSIVTEVPGENFTPNLTAYLNFYPFTGRTAQLGGTFGVGIPVSATSRNFNFLFGGSAILGTKNKVALHAGATLGQVNALDNGIEVGDQLENAFDPVSLKPTYNWGGFVGISFSIANIKN